jgi:hypothetical protein
MENNNPTSDDVGDDDGNERWSFFLSCKCFIKELPDLPGALMTIR